MKKIFVFLILMFFGYCGYSQFMYRDNGEKVFFDEDTLVKYIHFTTVNENVQQIIYSLNKNSYCEWEANSRVLRCELYPNRTNYFNEICISNRDEICFISSEFSNKKSPTICGITNKIFVQTDNIDSVYSYLTKNQIPLEKIEPVSIERNEYVLIFKPQCVNTLHIANQICENVDVKYSQPEFLHRNLFQNPLYPYQWGEHNIGQYCDTSGFDIRIENAWNITKGDSSIIVAVIDQGVDTSHEDLRSNLVQGKNVITGANNGQEAPFVYHGTACAGIIAAADNNLGSVGVAPHCRILPIVKSSTFYTFDSHIVKAFNYIADSSSAAVASCSWLPNWLSSTVDNALIHFARNGRNGKGGLVIFSAGNQNEHGDMLSDSCKPYCIVVGAICPDGTRKEYTSCDGDNSWGSNYGECLCVMAPGTKVPTTMSVTNVSDYTYVGDDYILDFDGTSAACPHVAGVGALVLSANPNLSGRKVKEIIERTCTKVRQDIYDYDSIAPHGAWDYQMGYGLVNAYQAVLMAQGCKDYPYCTIDTIRGNVTWSNSITVGETLVIDSLATLTVTDTVAFYSTARIIVRPGGALVVSGGTLTNACDGEMWEGIIVEGNVNQRQYASKQGRVILTNATIENAREAITTRGVDDATLWDKTGGIVQATNTLFHNNRRSAEFLTYENHTSGNVVSDNISHFTRCTFTIDDNNLFVGNDAHFGAHITMYKVRGVKVNGCAFRNEVTTTTNSARGNAISTIEAGFKAKRVCPVVSPFDPCSCFSSGSDTVTRCSFSGFHSAISAANSEGNYDITIDNCDFAQNTYGVDMAVCNDVQVSSCDFNLDGNKTIYGITLTNCTGYKIEDNSFYKTVFSSPVACGTNIIKSGIEDNVIRLNRFSNIKFGCGAMDTNALTGMDVQGLHYECNSFENCMNSIYVFSGASVRTVQGSNSAGADNGFGYPAGSGKSITIPASHDTVTYYYSKWGNYIPYGNTRIRLRGTFANNCLSSICWEPQPIELLSQYQEMAEEMLALYDTVGNRTLDPQDAETAELQMRLADLSSAMGDLSRNGIRAILSDTTLDMELLKEWYGTIVETRDIAARHRQLESGIPVAAYHLAEVYNTEGDYAAADALLQSLPQRFNPDEAARHEYENYMNLQRLRESVAGNWYRQTDTEIAELQQVAEYDNGRAARMAKEILCFFHHICYEDEPLLPEWDGGADGRGLHRDVSGNVSNATATGLRIHPNPANTTLTVESDSPVREITVYNLTGQVMMTIENCPSPASINVVSLPRGIYLLRAVTDNGVKTARFVKN